MESFDLFQVQSVPTVLGIKNGKVLDQFIGLQDDDKLKTFVEKLLNWIVMVYNVCDTTSCVKIFVDPHHCIIHLL